MSDRVRDAFVVLIERMEEPPTWEELTVEELSVAAPAVGGSESNPVRRGALIAPVAAGVVLLLGSIGLLRGADQVSDTPVEVGKAELVVADVISGEEDPAWFAVGFDSEGALCVEAGSATAGEFVCGGEGLNAVAVGAFGRTAVAGFAPSSTTGISVVFPDGRRHSVDLVPVPGDVFLAFGMIDLTQPTSVAIEVTNTRGATERHSLTVTTPAGMIGWETVPLPAVQDLGPPVWTGRELVFPWIGTTMGHAYDLETGVWREFPVEGQSWWTLTGAWTGTEAVFCCSPSAWAYRPDTDALREFSGLPFDFGSAQMIWTGERIYVVAEGFEVAAYDPEIDEWEIIEPAEAYSTDPIRVAWTGSKLIVMTDSRAFALDPEGDSWRVLGERGRPERAEQYDYVYSESGIFMWGELNWPNSHAAVGWMLDPEVGQWVQLPSTLPDQERCECQALRSEHTVWTGESWLVSTNQLSRSSDDSGPVLIAYHPDEERWTYEGPSPLGSNQYFSGSRAYMAGERVILQGVHNLYVSPPGWQPQGSPIEESGPFYVVTRPYLDQFETD